MRWPTAIRARTSGALTAIFLCGYAASAQAQPDPPPEGTELAPAPAAPEPAPAPPPAEPPKKADAPVEASASPAHERVLPEATKKLPDATAPTVKQDEGPPDGFTFGSYGRMIAATDGRGGPGRDADLVAHGSRLDEYNYVELELRRDDTWIKTGARTRLVATLAVANPVFHYSGEFDIKLAVRNLYIEERGLLHKGLSLWAGSRMYRGDDIYLLDWWPLDNLNTVGAGARFNFSERTMVAVHGGLSQPESIFYKQDVDRPSAANGWGANTVNVLDRQKFIGSAKFSHIIPLQGGAGLKGVAYAEAHGLPSGQKETDPGVFEDLPGDDGFVVGAQFGAFTGKRDTHLNLFIRYATGLAAYGEFASPFSLALDRTTSGAHEFLVALGGNWEAGPVGVMLGAYIRTFRNANPDLDFGDIDEGIIAVRPHVFFGEIGGIAVEASHQVQQRGVLLPPSFSPGQVPGLEAPEGPLTGSITRFGIVPFFSPAGAGDYSRPHFRVIYSVTLRNDGARQFYPQDDIFNLRSTEHFFGVGAEWWFNSSYGG
ncbi:MAG: carbohydrate porin [Polyangiaceae bacterium]|nr:carbohydrate porin [Polyangiaceae bacterium]